MENDLVLLCWNKKTSSIDAVGFICLCMLMLNVGY
jgi:hypothetical protein